MAGCHVLPACLPLSPSALQLAKDVCHCRNFASVVVINVVVEVGIA